MYSVTYVPDIFTRNFIRDNGAYAPLHHVAEQGDLEVVKELIDQIRIPVDVPWVRGKDPTAFGCVMRDTLALVEFLTT
ncbi:MAG: ankyrin repeat domain-containing protein [Amoebophilaceae bacterium]|nr:ankyrin repeat domain-containing protein [Amoebophilaceae bacterium]